MHTYISIHTCPHRHLYTPCTHLYIHAYACTHTHLHIHMHTLASIHTYIHMHTNVSLHTCTHTNNPEGTTGKNKSVMLPGKLLNLGSPTQLRHSSFAWKRGARPSHAAQKPYCWELHSKVSNSSDSGITSPLLTCLRLMGSQHVKCLQMCWNQPSFKKPAIFQNDAPVCHSEFN